MAKRISQAKARAPLVFAPWTLADAMALKAWAAGTADKDQQLRAFDWVVKKAGGIGAMSFGATARDTDFNEGSRFVAAQIVYFVTTATDTLKKKESTP